MNKSIYSEKRVNVRDYGILLQNLVTYEAVTNLGCVMTYFYMPNFCRVFPRITLICDILCIQKLCFFLFYRQIQRVGVLTDLFALWKRSMLLIFLANWHSVGNQCLEKDPHLDCLIYILSSQKMFLESYYALRLDEEDSLG